MKEVSCRVFEIFFRPLREKAVAEERLVVGTAVDLATLKDKNERVDWNDFAAVMANVGKCFTDDELVEIGRSYFRSPMLRFAAVIARLTFSPLEFYRWIFKPRDGVGNQMFIGVVTVHREISEKEIEVDLSLPDGFAMCREFFVVSKGNFIEMPRLLGYEGARVELTLGERNGRFRIDVPQGASVLTRARRAVLWPLTIRAAGRELKEAHETLLHRYEQLEEARATLDGQAKRLRTAHVVNEAVQGDLDLERTIDAITRVLVDDAGFAGVDLEVDATLDGVAVRRLASRGDVRGSTLSRPLGGRGGMRIGQIRVHTGGDDAEDRDALLSFIVPTLGMALDNAISYEVLADYRRGLEKRVDERTAELTQARDELAETVVRLEEAKNSRDKIFANVNHEIRTPLSMIILAVGDARTAQNGHGDARTARTLQTIEHGARRLLRMVDDLLLLAEGRESEIKLHLEATNLTAIVEGIAHAWMPAAKASEIALGTALSGECVVRADTAAIERALSNLVSNALKFTPKGGRITLRLSERDGKALLDVEDTGVGIDDELRGRLFGRFERAHSAKANAIGGSGIGLSLVKDLVEAHGGTIDVDSKVGEGTRFRIELPAFARSSLVPVPPSAKLRPEDFGIVAAPADAASRYAPDGAPLGTILVAEDDPILRDSIGRLLSADYVVYVAQDGEEALRLASKHSPDILVTDVSMPKMDGVELTRRFLDLPGNRLAPVLVLTAFGEIRDRLAGFAAGAVDYIVKPFEPAELRARVKSQLAIRSLALQLMETEKLAALGTLAAGLAHEMRNPANGIVNAVAPLRDLLPPDASEPGTPTAELLDVIEKCSETIAGLSRQLLGFQRGVTIDRKPIPVEALLRRVRRTVQPLLNGREYREKLDYRGPLPCAEPLLSQVLANLLDNAAFAAGTGGWVEVRSAVEDANVVIEVADSGPGVPVDLRSRIFDPFFTTKPAGQGTGLGLPTAREIITRHGGTLDVRERSGKTFFRIELPLEAGA